MSDKNDYIGRVHDEILLIMDEVVRICEENNIMYYMIGGTLLGAVRHKGFIPWDDDFDIVMPRKDFERFVKIFNSEANKPYTLEWITTNDNYWLLFAKVCNSNTVFDESSRPIKGKPFGIFVDIFPLDDAPVYNKKVEVQKKIVKKLANMMVLKLSPDRGSGLKKCILSFFSVKFLNGLAMRIMKQGNKEKNSFYVNFGSQYSIKKQTINKEYFAQGKELEFENKKYRAPLNYEGVLKSIFGSEYMQIPPIDKRRTHYPKKVVFSDGQELVFENQGDRVAVE